MSLWDTAKRAIAGRDYDEYEDFDDEYYEDEYEEEKPKRTFFSFLSKNKADDYDDEYEEKSISQKYTPSRNTYSSSTYKKSDDPIKKQISKVLPKSLEGVEVSIFSPTSFDDSSKIVKEVKNGKITVFDMSSINNVEEARRIVDYICGAAEGMDCPFSRICPSVFCIAPVGVVFNGKRTRY